MKYMLSSIALVLLLVSPRTSVGQDADQTKAPATPDPEFSPQGIYTGPLELPHIVRYRDLPLRMHLEPYIPPPPEVRRLDDRLVPLWERMLREATDAEVQEIAALSLSRVAELGLTDIQLAGPALLAGTDSGKSDRIRYACARALAAGDIQSAAPNLIKMAAEGTDTQRLTIEPALAKWKAESASELWRPRIVDPFVTRVSFRLAAEGLAAVDDSSSVESLLATVSNPGADYANRTAAAHAVAILNPQMANATANSLITGDVPDRILALALLDNTGDDSPVKSASLCGDSANAVASIAWQQTSRRNPEVLTGYLSSGLLHPDASVRMTAARVVRLFPDAERVSELHKQLSDIHIEVRNVARQMLFAVAEEHSELKDQIIGQAADMLKPDSRDWQGIEQSLVLLGQLHTTQFSAACLALLGHSHEEVSISASWLIQLSPDESIREPVRNYIESTESELAAGQYRSQEMPLLEAMLLQYAGLLRIKELQPLYEKQFSKAAPGNAIKRASALWALALLHEKNPLPDLAAKYVERIQDRAAPPPEELAVRRMSVMALGLMRASSTSKVVLDAYTLDPRFSLIPETARWVLPLLDQPAPPEFGPQEFWVGGWRINPVSDPKPTTP